MKRIYIAGKMTGEVETPDLMQKCIEKFNNYGMSLSFGRWSQPQNLLSRNADSTIAFTHGFFINWSLISEGGADWLTYMRNDIKTLMLCDEIHMLKDWESSKGAKIEHDLAKSLGIKIVYEK